MVSLLTQDQAGAAWTRKLNFLLEKVLDPGAGSAGRWRFSFYQSLPRSKEVKSLVSGRPQPTYQLYQLCDPGKVT